MKAAFLTGVMALALAGCASSSGVYQVGPDTYRVTSTAITSFGGEGTAQASNVRAANEKCAQQGKHAEVIDGQSDAQITQASASVTFRCVA